MVKLWCLDKWRACLPLYLQSRDQALPFDFILSERGGEGERGGMRLSQTQASFAPTDKVSNISFSNSIPQWNLINSWKCIINYGIVKPEHLSSHNRVWKFKFCKHFPKVMRMSAIYTSFQKFKTRNSGKIH